MGCPQSYSVTETKSDLAIRVLVTSNPLEKTAIAAEGTTALQYDLTTAFAAEQSTQVWLHSYSRNTLTEAFPELSKYTNQQIVETLAPRVDGSDGFVAPQSDIVAQISDINRENQVISYSSSTWNQWLQFAQEGNSAGLRFQLPATIGCPWGNTSLRLFMKSAPNTVCTVSRDSFCNWKFVQCDSEVQSSICRASTTQSKIFQSPNGDLNLGDFTCALQETEDTQGISQTWSCSAGACGASSTTLASQEVPLLSDIALDDRQWKAKAIDEHQATFPTGRAVYDGKRDLILSAYEDTQDQVRLRSYQWLISEGNVDTVEQREIIIEQSETIASAEYGQLRSLWMHKDRSVAILNGENLSYLLKNKALDLGDARQMVFSKPLKISHDLSANGIVLSEPRDFFPSEQQPGNFYAVSNDGIVVFDDSANMINATPKSEGLLLNSGHYRLFIGNQNLQERVIVCALVQPAFEHCGLGIYVFDSQGQFLGEKRIDGALKAVTRNLDGVFEDGKFKIGKVDLTQGATDLEYQEIYVPAINTPQLQTARRLNISRKSFSYNNTLNLGTSVVGLSYGRFAGVLDLDSGLSTAVSASPDQPVTLLAMITNILQTGHFLLVQENSRESEPRWVYVPSLR